MAVVMIANTSGQVSGLFLTQRSVAHSWSAPQTFPSGTAPAPGVVVGPAQLGFFETATEIHYTKGGVDQGEIATLVSATFLGLTDTPGSYVGQRGKFTQVDPAEGQLVFFGGVKSNLIAHDGNDYIVVPVPVGDGQVLTSDTLEATGIKWATNGFSGVVPAPTLVGQVLFSADGSTYSLLNIGSVDDVLTVAAGVPVWSAPAPSNAISQLDSNVTVTDTGSDGAITIVADGIVRGLFDSLGLDVKNGDVRAGIGSALVGAAPSSTVPTLLPLATETTTGVGLAATNEPSIIAGGVEAMRLGANAIGAAGTVLTSNGVGTAATWQAAGGGLASWEESGSDPDTLFRPTAANTAGQLTTNLGSVSAPAIAPTVRLDSGFYFLSSGVIKITVQGADQFDWDLSGFNADASGGPRIVNATANVTTATIRPRGSSNAGLGIRTVTSLDLIADGVTLLELERTGGQSFVGFFDKVATPALQPTVTGSRAGNAALASFLTGMAALGLIIDSSTA